MNLQKTEKRLILNKKLYINTQKHITQLIKQIINTKKCL